jgi:hypothetical protein
MKGAYATLVVQKRKGGYATILNSSQRGLFHSGQCYFNHQLKTAAGVGEVINVVVRLSVTGRRMVQEIYPNGGRK